MGCETQPEKRYRIYTLIQDNPRLICAPDAALLLSGEHRYVFVDRGGGQLRPTEVEVGALTGAWDEVASGLRAGDRVATGATFLLSSEAKLRDALPRWNETP